MRDIARIDILSGADELGDPVGVRERADRLRLGFRLPEVLAKRHTARLEHARDEIVQLEERVARVVPEALFEVAPLAFPIVSVETGLLLHAWVVPRLSDRETRQ